MTALAADAPSRFDRVKAEWLAIARQSPPNLDRFAQVKREAESIIAAGLWTSGPSDLLSILGRQRDELVHSRLIGWLLGPTNQHGLGRQFLTAFVDYLWPGEGLLRSGQVMIETETTRSASDEVGMMREARADIVLYGNGVTVLVENKLDAGEQPDQCERLYWAWADQPADTRWVFLTPAGRAPVTTRSAAARSAWRTMSYGHLREILASAMLATETSLSSGRPSAVQYLATLTATMQPER